jgi:hypothetical protein
MQNYILTVAYYLSPVSHSHLPFSCPELRFSLRPSLLARYQEHRSWVNLNLPWAKRNVPCNYHVYWHTMCTDLVSCRLFISFLKGNGSPHIASWLWLQPTVWWHIPSTMRLPSVPSITCSPPILFSLHTVLTAAISILSAFSLHDTFKLMNFASISWHLLGIRQVWFLECILGGFFWVWA